MTRPKEYERENVLDLAVGLFRHKGYKGTSMDDLVKITRLNRFSMYSEFGDKEKRF